MIKVFYGEDRVEAEKAIKQFLGESYEVLEGSEIRINDLPSVFLGTSLFGEERSILIKDMGANMEVFQRVLDYTNTPHKVVIWEMKFDGRVGFYKELKEKVKTQEFKRKEANDKTALNIYGVAKRDGKKAVEMLEKIEAKQDPFMLFGLISALAIKDYEKYGGEKEKRVLKELSRVDILMKTTSIPQFLLLKSLLLRISSL